MAAIGLVIGGYLLASNVVMQLDPWIRRWGSSNAVTFYENLVVGGLLLMIVLLTLWLTNRNLWRFIGPISWRVVALYAPFYAVCYLCLTSIAQRLLVVLVPAFNVNQTQNIGYGQLSWRGLLAAALALIVIAPFTEELLFRGFIYRGLRPAVGRIVGATLTSALFGLVHGQWNVAVDTFLLSMVMIYAYEKHRSLWLTMAIHALKNSLAFILLFVIK